MSEQEKKQQRIYDLLNTETKPKFLCLLYTKQRKDILLKNSFLRKWRIEKKKKKKKQGFLTALTTAIKKNPTTSIRKHANEFWVHEKTVRTAIKQGLNLDLNSDHAIWGVLENKTNRTSHPNIDSLKTVIEEEWNKISEEFILKACKSFWRGVDTIIEKMAAILSKFTVLCLTSYFVVYFFKLELILFYNRVIYYYIRIFLILLTHPVFWIMFTCNFVKH